MKKNNVISLSKLKDIITGQEAQTKGLSFENDIEGLLEKHKISNIRIPQSSRVVKDRKTNQLITISRSGVLDFILFSKGKSYLIDCKSTNKDFLYRSFFINYTSKKSTNTQTQYKKMAEILKASKFLDIGFIIDFNRKIKFISIKKMINHFKKNKTISFRAGITIEQFIESVKQGR